MRSEMVLGVIYALLLLISYAVVKHGYEARSELGDYPAKIMCIPQDDSTLICARSC